MFDFSALNWWAILGCMIVCVISGSTWFNPKTFFTVWWRGIGKSESDIPGNGQNMGIVFGLTFLSSFVQPLIMAIVLHLMFPNGATIIEGITTGCLLWFGFVAPTYLVNKLFAGHPIYVWAIEVSNHLVNFVLFGLILSAWK